MIFHNLTLPQHHLSMQYDDSKKRIMCGYLP